MQSTRARRCVWVTGHDDSLTHRGCQPVLFCAVRMDARRSFQTLFAACVPSPAISSRDQPKLFTMCLSLLGDAPVSRPFANNHPKLYLVEHASSYWTLNSPSPWFGSANRWSTV